VISVYRAPSDPGMRYPCFVDPEPPERRNGLRKRPAFPRVDEQIVRPETREELVRGRAVVATPAKEQHAERHYEIDYLTRGVLAPGYVGATDLLTRSGPKSDFATDTCIRREGVDPATGARYLEELAFEIVNEQSLRDITERAEDLAGRGVRRIIGIFVKKNEVREWSAERGDWVVLEPSGSLDDRTLSQPIPIRALLDGAEADNAVVRALRAKQNPELVAIEAAAAKEGAAQASRKAIEGLCRVLGIPFDDERRALIQCFDAAALELLLDGIMAERRWP
jgi:hypothetical protein